MTIASDPEEVRARRPLAGYRVIDAASIVAGPFAASILGEFGAEVIKIGGGGMLMQAVRVHQAPWPLLRRMTNQRSLTFKAFNSGPRRR